MSSLKSWTRVSHPSPQDEKRDQEKRPRSNFLSASLRCIIEGCSVDLNGSKDYYQRHKVCEVHARAPTAVLKGETVRFCQQCSRFHPLHEFDEGKRSCRRRLLGHNKRRRKKEEPTSEAEETPPPKTRPGVALAAHDARQDAWPRGTPSLLLGSFAQEKPPTRQLGQGLSLSPFSQQEAAPGSNAPSLAVSQFLRDSVLQHAAAGSTLTADFLGRTLGLSATQQLLLGFQHLHRPENEVKMDAEGALQLHFPNSSKDARLSRPNNVLPQGRNDHSPPLQQLLDKSSPNHPRPETGRQAVTETSSLFPLPSELHHLGVSQAGTAWSGPSAEGVVDPSRMTIMPGPYLPYDRTGRISFKLFDKNPNDLPDDLRDQILDWLQRRPSAMETYLRPGCVHVSAYLSMPQADWDVLERDLRSHLSALISSQTWTDGKLYAFVAESVAYAEKGIVQSVHSPAQVAGPVLHSVQPRWVVAGQPVDITITGRGLLHADNRLLCLHREQRFLDNYLSSPLGCHDPTPLLRRTLLLTDDQNTTPNAACMEQEKAGSTIAPSRGLEWSPRVEGGSLRNSTWSKDPVTGEEALSWTLAALPEESLGTMFVEMDRAGFPSNTKSILVAPAAVCAELASLAGELESVGPPKSDAHNQAEKQVDALLHDLGWVLGCGAHNGAERKRADGRMCVRLLAFARERNWRHTMGLILQSTAVLGLGRGEVVDGAHGLGGDKLIQRETYGDMVRNKTGVEKLSSRLAPRSASMKARMGQSPAVKPLLVQELSAKHSGAGLGASMRPEVLAPQVACMLQAVLEWSLGAARNLITSLYTRAIACTLLRLPWKLRARDRVKV